MPVLPVPKYRPSFPIGCHWRITTHNMENPAKSAMRPISQPRKQGRTNLGKISTAGILVKNGNAENTPALSGVMPPFSKILGSQAK